MDIAPREQDSIALRPADKLLAYDLAKRGFQHKRIAALFDVNQGRIAEAIALVERALS